MTYLWLIYHGYKNNKHLFSLEDFQNKIICQKTLFPTYLNFASPVTGTTVYFYVTIIVWQMVKMSSRCEGRQLKKVDEGKFSVKLFSRMQALPCYLS